MAEPLGMTHLESLTDTVRAAELAGVVNQVHAGGRGGIQHLGKRC